jgi:hypothetical protein
MDEWDRVSAVDCHLAWSSPNHISLVFLIKLLALPVILEVMENTCKHTVKLG